MTDAALCYERLEARVLRGRALAILPEESEDAILEEMDDLWRRMTPEERETANGRGRAIQSATAPEDLRLRDVPVALGDDRDPREAA